MEHGFLRDLALVLAVAAFTTVLFQALKQPVVLGYLIAGAIVSPHTPIPLFVDLDVIHAIAELGVILLMFSLGLEFSLRRLVEVGPRAAFVAVFECSVMVGLGFAVGQAFGWTVLECTFLGGAIAISSTTIIVKAFAEQKVTGPLARLVLAFLIVEDLIAVLLLAILTPLASGAKLSLGDLGFVILRLGSFLAAILLVGFVTVPRAIRYVTRLNRDETTVVAAIGTCFLLAFVAQAAGYSVALGAFLGGSLVAESGQGKHIEHLIRPVRDMFAAVFFVAVGMLLDPRTILDNWVSILVLTVIVIVGKTLAVSTAAALAGFGSSNAVRAGLSMAQIGEFSFIIASMGSSLGAVGPFLYPVAIAVSAATALTTPWLIRAAPSAAHRVDHLTPRPIATAMTLYESWIERLGSAQKEMTFARSARRVVILITVDAAAILAVLLARSLIPVESLPTWASFGSGILVELGALLICVPFALGILRGARTLSLLLAEQVFVGPANARVRQVGSARNLLIFTLEVLVVLGVGTPVVALSLPILATYQPLIVFTGAAIFGSIALWRRARGLDADVRAGVQSIVDAVQSTLPGASSVDLPTGEHHAAAELASGALRVEAAHYAVGRSLRAMDLRSRTGAMALGLERGTERARVPTPDDPFQVGDLIALAGSKEAIESACTYLRVGPEALSEPQT